MTVVCMWYHARVFNFVVPLSLMATMCPATKAWHRVSERTVIGCVIGQWPTRCRPRILPTTTLTDTMGWMGWNRCIECNVRPKRPGFYRFSQDDALDRGAQFAFDLLVGYWGNRREKLGNGGLDLMQ